MSKNELKAYAAMEGTLVFLMGFHSLSSITEGLIRGGKSPQTPAAPDRERFSFKPEGFAG